MRKWLVVMTLLALVFSAPTQVVAHDDYDDQNRNTNTNRNQNYNSQDQWQGQSQYQAQGQSQSSRNTNRNQATGVGIGVGVGTGGEATQGQSSSISNDTSVPRQAPPASAPNLVAAPETCMGSSAIGASTPFGGVSVGTTYKSTDCELRMFARSLQALGQNEAALALLAQNSKVAAALRAAGTKAVWLLGEKDQSPAIVSQTTGPTHVVSGSTNFGRVQEQP